MVSSTNPLTERAFRLTEKVELVTQTNLQSDN